MTAIPAWSTVTLCTDEDLRTLEINVLQWVSKEGSAKFFREDLLSGGDNLILVLIREEVRAHRSLCAIKKLSRQALREEEAPVLPYGLLDDTLPLHPIALIIGKKG